MSALSTADRNTLEKHFGMSSGCILNFSNRTFGEFVFETVGIDIHDEKYTTEGTSKAKKLRTFWKLESDVTVGKLLLALIDCDTSLNGKQPANAKALADKCRKIATRLLASGPCLNPLKEYAKLLHANHLAEQIRRLEPSIETDPSLAIGTAKELIETVCLTILADRGKPLDKLPDLPALTKLALKELNLLPDGIDAQARGAETIKRTLSNLASIVHGLAELRNLYGTGHGRHGQAKGLKPRHAKLAVGATTTLATFLFETYEETKP